MERLLIKQLINDFGASFEFESLLIALPKIKACYPNDTIFMGLSDDEGIYFYILREETDAEYDRRANHPMTKLALEMNKRKYEYLKKMFGDA